MEIRLLQSGEESLWLSLNQKSFPPEEMKSFTRLREVDGPEGFVVALKNGKMIGRLRGFFPTADTYLMQHVCVAPGFDFTEVAPPLIDHVRKLRGKMNLQASVWAEPEEALFDAYLLSNGFECYIEKVYVRRELATWTNPYEPRLTYKSMAELGEDAFVRVLRGIYDGAVNRDLDRERPELDLKFSIEFAGSAFDPRNWLLAYLDGEEAGVVLPQLFDGEPDKGTLAFVGVAKCFRGLGLGRELHAHGLDVLKAKGAERYVGSTDVLNKSMQKIFEVHGCEPRGRRREFRVLDKGESHANQ